MTMNQYAPRFASVVTSLLDSEGLTHPSIHSRVEKMFLT